MSKSAASKNVVVYMTEPTAKFVSLVRRGANRTPFRIVKQQKETPMKIIQRIVAKKGVDASMIQAAVGAEAAEALNLATASESGVFTQYVQHPEEAFKADSLEVISLRDDNSILCICGELVEKSESFVSKLLARKEEKSVGVEVPESWKPVPAAALKSDLSCQLWTELDALACALRGVLAQDAGETGTKLSVCQTLCENFLKSLEATAEVLKSEDFGPRPVEEPTPAVKTEDPAPAAGAEPEPEGGTAPEGASVPTPQLDEAAVITRAEEAARATAEAIAKAQAEALAEAMKPLQEQLTALGTTVEKMQKAPAAPVASHEDSGIQSDVKKSQEGDVFRGIFGTFGR